MSFSAEDSTIQHFKSLKPIAWNVRLEGSNITVSDTIIEATSSTESFPFNTDGFDIGGTDISILNSVIYNGDDAIAVGSGSHNILFSGGTIGYQTHGMSIGSLGKDPTDFANVTDVRFEDITVVNGVYAARFKSWLGGQGLAKNISWSNVRLYNVTFPIYVTQTYYNQDSASVGTVNNQTVNMVDFSWEDFTGTINTLNPGDGSCVSDVSLGLYSWYLIRCAVALQSLAAQCSVSLYIPKSPLLADPPFFSHAGITSASPTSSTPSPSSSSVVPQPRARTLC